MLVYIISLLTSVFFANRALKSNSVIWHVMSMAMPIILLTFRATSVGTDTFHYEDLYINALTSYNYWEFILTSRIEYGFATVLYLCSLTNLSVQFAFFVIAVLTILPVYIAVWILRKRLSVCYALTIFYLLFYQYSFNVSRQAIAMSFILLALALLLNEKKKLSLIISIVAILFHNIALFSIPLSIIYLIRDRNRFQIIILLVVIMAIIFYFGKEYIESSKEYYTGYLSGEKASAQASYLVEMGFNAFIAAIGWSHCKTKESAYLLFLSLVTFTIIACSGLFSAAFRIAYCFDIFAILYISIFMRSRSANFRKLYMCFCVFFWWFVFVYNNSGITTPYIFR